MKHPRCTACEVRPRKVGNRFLCSECGKEYSGYEHPHIHDSDQDYGTFFGADRGRAGIRHCGFEGGARKVISGLEAERLGNWIDEEPVEKPGPISIYTSLTEEESKADPNYKKAEYIFPNFTQGALKELIARGRMPRPVTYYNVTVQTEGHWNSREGRYIEGATITRGEST
jgi:hypothetical protein